VTYHPDDQNHPPYPGPQPQYPGYPAPPGPYGGYPGYPAYYPPPQETNVLAVVALVGALCLPPVGIVAGHIALAQIKRTGADGRGLAIAGLVLGYVFTVLIVLLIAMGIWVEATVGLDPDHPGGSYTATSGLADLQHSGPLPLTGV
jgi:peptidyl-prolyl cis-trans isomerase B (cyclophilin B)